MVNETQNKTDTCMYWSVEYHENIIKKNKSVLLKERPLKEKVL